MKIQTVEPKDSDYEEVARAVRNHGRNKFDYGLLQEKYNELEVGGFTIVQVNRTLKIGNIVTVMKGRGLVKSVDYDIVKLNRDVHGNMISGNLRPLVITKRTPRHMTQT
jgi:hypothetical protein